MFDGVIALMRESPVVALAIIAAAGYLLGQISIFGFRLGVAGVLFTGLALGALIPGLTLPAVLGTLGLVLFVYAMGLQSGKGFFESFERSGYRMNMLTVGAIAAGTLLMLLVARAGNLSGPQAAGLFTGAMTNTPALAGVLERTQTSAAAETYSIAYPFGVIGVLLAFHVARVIWKPEIEPADRNREILPGNYVVKNPGIANITVRELQEMHPQAGFQLSRIRRGDTTVVAHPDFRLEMDDVVVAVGNVAALRRAQAIFGAAAESHIEIDRSQIDFRRVFVSNRALVGQRLADLDVLNKYNCSITRLRRGDTDFIPNPDTRLQLGDRVRVVANREDLAAISRYFGDSIRGTAEMNFTALGLGLAVGVFVGTIPIPIAGFGDFRLGLAGGPLLTALVLGSIQRTGPISWVLPASANLTVRQFGLMLFLATVGLSSGPGFAGTVKANGIVLVALGAVVTLGVALSSLVVGYKVLRIPFDELLGVVSGIHTESAAVAFASNMTQTDRPETGYASVYPVALILKVMVAQIIAGVETY